MKVNDNGIVRDLTPKEIAKMERMAAEFPSPEPTPEERLQALEAAGLERDMALMELAAMFAGGAMK